MRASLCTVVAQRRHAHLTHPLTVSLHDALPILNKYMEKDWKPNREVQRQLHDASVQDAVDALVSAQFTRKSADEMAEGLIALARANTTLDQDSEVKRPLLSIELQDESSVPKVIYKGEEVKYKRNVFLDWDTDTDRKSTRLNSSHVAISYAVFCLK